MKFSHLPANCLYTLLHKRPFIITKQETNLYYYKPSHSLYQSTIYSNKVFLWHNIGTAMRLKRKFTHATINMLIVFTFFQHPYGAFLLPKTI